MQPGAASAARPPGSMCPPSAQPLRPQLLCPWSDPEFRPRPQTVVLPAVQWPGRARRSSPANARPPAIVRLRANRHVTRFVRRFLRRSRASASPAEFASHPGFPTATARHRHQPSSASVSSRSCGRAMRYCQTARVPRLATTHRSYPAGTSIDVWCCDRCGSANAGPEVFRLSARRDTPRLRLPCSPTLTQSMRQRSCWSTPAIILSLVSSCRPLTLLRNAQLARIRRQVRSQCGCLLVLQVELWITAAGVTAISMDEPHLRAYRAKQDRNLL